MLPKPACVPETRSLHLERLQTEIFDVLIIGGGINGAGVARDLALRSRLANLDLKIGLIEKNQFGSGTSGRNSHLVHGGLRYLKYFDFRLVGEALGERSTLLEIAPHLVEPLSLILPFASRKDQWFYGAGLMLYDMLAGKRNVGRHRQISLKELKQVEPNLNSEQISAAAIFFDCRMEAARLVLENIWDAVANGVAAANYIQLLDYQRQGELWKVQVRDSISGQDWTLQTRNIVDATGAWMKSASTRLVRGSHLVFPRLNHSDHAVAYFETEGRIVFFVPWGTQLGFTLVGTTDIDHEGGADHVSISQAERTYLLELTRKLFRKQAVGDPVASFSSLRPLVKQEGKSATSTSREHRIWFEQEGLLRISGGKYTTYRAMSEEAVDLLLPRYKDLHPTAEHPLSGNSREAIALLMEEAPRLAAEHTLGEETVRSWIRGYGLQVRTLLSYAASLGTSAPIAYAARHEMALHLRDLLFVSTTWGYENRWDRQNLRTYSRSFGRFLGWNEEKLEREAEEILASTTAPV